MNTDQLIALVNAQVNQQVDAMCAKAGQLTLGELAARLDSCDKQLPVVFSDGGCPGEFMSYRGYYRFIAVERLDEKKTVAEFLGEVNHAIGHTYEGYKGGDYKMTRMTPVWVSEYGASSGCGIVGVEKLNGSALLVVAEIEDKS